MMNRSGLVRFGEFETWFGIYGSVERSLELGYAPLVVLHGGPGATHDYLLDLADLSSCGRAVIFYDQLGNGNSTHLRDAPVDFWTMDLFKDELNNLVKELGVADRYHVLGQSWGGFLAQEHAIERPHGLRSVVLSNTAASFPDFITECNKLRQQLPTEVESTLRKHETEGTTDSAEYLEACEVFYRRHLLRLDEWPAHVAHSFALIDADPTVYHTMNGPSEFHVIGTAKNWTSVGRLAKTNVPTLVISGEFDEATPALQETLVSGISGAEQILLKNTSHLAFVEDPGSYMAAVATFLAKADHNS